MTLWGSHCAVGRHGFTWVVFPALLGFFVDAGLLPHGRYGVGLFHETLGVQVHIPPPTIRSQQEAEAYALEYVLRVGIRLSPAGFEVVGDNMGALFNLLSLQPRVSNFVMVRIFRRIYNRLYWSRVQVHAGWVPSALQPADPPSRFDPSSGIDARTMLNDTVRRLTCLLASAYPSYLGSVSL